MKWVTMVPTQESLMLKFHPVAEMKIREDT